MPYKDKAQQNQYQLRRLKLCRETWLRENGPCIKCGSWDRLEVDHIDPSSKVSHKVWSWSEVRRSEELAKCQVLCYKCHKEKSKTDVSIQLQGEKNHQAKLTESDVLKIRELRNQGFIYREIAGMFGVSKRLIGHIIKGTKWKHLGQ